MLDIKLIREQQKLVEQNLKKRGDTGKLKLLHDVISADKKRREAIQQAEKLKHQRNILTREIASLKSKGKTAASKLREVKSIPDKIKKLDVQLALLDERCRLGLMSLPNMLHESVPVGTDESGNVETRKYGKKPEFDFGPRSHLDILKQLGMIDFERAAKTSGAGFYYLKGDAVILDMALQRFAIDFLTKQRGFTIVEPPLMINRTAYEGVIDAADFEMVTYKVENEDLYLIATAEHPLGAQFMGETFSAAQLPLKLAGISPCFRKEVGSHGKYTKGLFRVHHFNKIEQFVFCKPEASWQLFEELQQNAEALYQQLGLHYRVVSICTGDIGNIAAKKYDIEVWMADDTFRESGSCSNCTDYQARRLGIKYREKEGSPPIGFVHTLNNTALATSRAMIAVIEQFQQEDGTVAIPKALQPYTGFPILGA
ncbi:MAG: serine--tRNA ligase [Candidatus Aenigmarchaeota archaeon]|nr:serine--tRNA ligase [Candidatus Aenigmarchaeota archaeon]